MFAWNARAASRGPGASTPARYGAGSGHRLWHGLVLLLLALLAWALPGPAHAQGMGDAAPPGPAGGSNKPVTSSDSALAPFAAARAATSALTVEFVQPQRYVDASDAPGGAADPEVLALIERQLQKSAAPCLPAGQTLVIHVLDIDLAGDVDMARRRFGDSVRVLRERARPRIELAYTLTRAGVPGAEVHEQVVDGNYLMHLGHARYDDARLPYERAMLARWFEARFCAGAAATVH